MHLLIRNYVYAVGKYLPESQREDILNELSANLAAEIDDRETELGRVLSEDELAAVIRQHGHPMLVAARYAPQRSLIGPALFPIYWYVLKRAIPIAALVYAIASAVGLVTGPHSASDAVRTVLGFVPVAFTVSAWVTLVFAIGEFAASKYRCKMPPNLYDWNPRDLPAKSPRQQPMWGRIFGVVFGILGTCWFALVPKYPFLLLGPGASYLASSPVRLAPVWELAYWPIVLFLFTRTAVEFVALFRPPSRQRSAWTEAVLHSVSLVGFALFLSVGDYFRLSPVPAAAEFHGTVSGMNQAVQILCALAIVIDAWEVSKAVRQAFLEPRRGRLAPPSNVIL